MGWSHPSKSSKRVIITGRLNTVNCSLLSLESISRDFYFVLHEISLRTELNPSSHFINIHFLPPNNYSFIKGKLTFLFLVSLYMLLPFYQLTETRYILLLILSSLRQGLKCVFFFLIHENTLFSLDFLVSCFL